MNRLQSEMKQMFRDMMSQLGTLSSVLAKSKDKLPSAAGKVAGRSDGRADGIREAGPGGSVIGNTAGLDVPRKCIAPF